MAPRQIFSLLLLGWAVIAVSGTADDASPRSDSSTCPLEKGSLEERESLSQVVFTGVVETVIDADSADVRIRKIFKGLAKDGEGKVVRVTGLEDPQLCPNRVRQRDTRIFLANLVDSTSPIVWDEDVPHPVRLQLSSSLVPVRLRYLQLLREVTDVNKDKAAVEKPQTRTLITPEESQVGAPVEAKSAVTEGESLYRSSFFNWLSKAPHPV